MGDPGRRVRLLDVGPGSAMVIVRFKVGEDEENALVRLNEKLARERSTCSRRARTAPLVKPRSIDDVPILALTLSSDGATTTSPCAARGAAGRRDQAGRPDVAEVTLIGGARAPAARAARSGDARGVRRSTRSRSARRSRRAERERRGGGPSPANREIVLEAGALPATSRGRGRRGRRQSARTAVYLRDVATIVDGPEEPADYVLLSPGAAARVPGGDDLGRQAQRHERHRRRTRGRARRSRRCAAR